MRAERLTVVDGQNYEAGEEIWDLGSWECFKVEDGNQRHYQGISTDVDKLPKYGNLEGGSTAMCLDTGDYYRYHAKSKTWFKL